MHLCKIDNAACAQIALHACRHFGLRDLAERTVQAILAFMPSLPNWAYNGAALGIGDFSNNAKLTPYGGWERVLQHYRAGALSSLSTGTHNAAIPLSQGIVMSLVMRLCATDTCVPHSSLMRCTLPAII